MESLPIELVLLIGGYLKRKDLISLSQASASLADTTRELRFKVVKLILWKDEWSKFLDFVQNGTHLHRFVQEIRIHAQSPESETSLDFLAWCKWLKISFCRFPRAGWERPTKAEGEEWLGSMSSDLPRIHIASKRENQERHEVIASVFSPDGLPIVLKRLTKVNSIMILTDGHGNEKRDGIGKEERPGRSFIESTFGTAKINAYYPRSSQSQWVSMQPENRSRYLDEDVLDPLLSTLNSITHSNLKELDIGNISWRYLLHSDEGLAAFPEWKRALKNIEKLSLFFTGTTCPDYHTPFYEIPQNNGLGIPQKIVQQTSSSLQQLRIGWLRDTMAGGVRNQWLPCNLLLAMQFPHLRLFSLCGFKVGMSAFERFLKRHYQTLEQLELHDFIFVPPKGGSAFFPKQPARHLLDFVLYITNNMNLRHASFSGSVSFSLGPFPAQLEMDFESKGTLFNHQRRLPCSDGLDSYALFGQQVGLAVATAQPWNDIDPERRQAKAMTSREARESWLKYTFYLNYAATLSPEENAMIDAMMSQWEPEDSSDVEGWD